MFKEQKLYLNIWRKFWYHTIALFLCSTVIFSRLYSWYKALKRNLSYTYGFISFNFATTSSEEASSQSAGAAVADTVLSILG